MHEAPWSRLKFLLDLSGESAREVDRLAGRAPGQVALVIARQQRALRDDVVVAYARVLGCTVGWLVGGEGEAPTSEAVLAAVARAKESPSVGGVFTASDFTREVGHEPPGEVAPDVEEPSGPVLVRADFDQTTTGA